MTPVVVLLVIAVLAFLIIRVGAMALEHTGLSRDASRFQALSAFFGAGFTTGESELVVNHPVRRRVIRDLIIVGNIGIVSLLTTGVATATSSHSYTHPITRIVIIAGGLLLLVLISKSRLIMKLVDLSISRTLKHSGFVSAMDYEKVLRTHSGYGIAEIVIEPGSSLVGHKLGESRPRDAGVTILGIAHADGSYNAGPGCDTVIHEGDTLLVYGADLALERLARLDKTEPVPPDDD